jgi:hypothetical protein
MHRTGPVALRAREQGRGLHALDADLIRVQARWQAEEIDEATSILERDRTQAIAKARQLEIPPE